MHSGINTYIPRGLNLLLERLDEDTIKAKRLQVPIKLLTDGLKHTQKVYEGVYAFTNLVKKKSQVEKLEYDLKEILDSFLESTSYKNSVYIEPLGKKTVNNSLFCNAINNFIKNGIAYNNSKEKLVKIYLRDNSELIIEDNGRGLTQYEYYLQCMPFIKSDEEEISGMGINIANAILEEHGFSVVVEEIENGTRLVIKTWYGKKLKDFMKKKLNLI